jgi:hypothetical protein
MLIGFNNFHVPVFSTSTIPESETSKISDAISSPKLFSKINSNVLFGIAVPVNLIN